MSCWDASPISKKILTLISDLVEACETVSDWIPQQINGSIHNLIVSRQIACVLPQCCILPYYSDVRSGGHRFWKSLHNWLLGGGLSSLARAQLSSVTLISNSCINSELELDMEISLKYSYTLLAESLFYMVEILNMFGEKDRNVILQQPDLKVLIQSCFQQAAALGNSFAASSVHIFATVYSGIGSLFFSNQSFLTRQMSNENNDWETDVMLAAWPVYLGCIKSAAYHYNIQRDPAKTQMRICINLANPLRMLDGKEAAIRKKYVVRHISAVLDIAAFAIADDMTFKRSNDSEGFNRSEIIQAILDMSTGCLYYYGTYLA